MELFATRGYFFCRYCGSFSFPETAGDDGIRILGESSESRQCAVCDKALASAMLDETHPVQVLPQLPRRVAAQAVVCRGRRETPRLGNDRVRSASPVEPERARTEGPVPGVQSADEHASVLRSRQRRHRQLWRLRSRVAGLRRAEADRRCSRQGSWQPGATTAAPRGAAGGSAPGWSSGRCGASRRSVRRAG